MLCLLHPLADTKDSGVVMAIRVMERKTTSNGREGDVAEGAGTASRLQLFLNNRLRLLFPKVFTCVASCLHGCQPWKGLEN